MRCTKRQSFLVEFAAMAFACDPLSIVHDAKSSIVTLKSSIAALIYFCILHVHQKIPVKVIVFDLPTGERPKDVQCSTYREAVDSAINIDILQAMYLRQMQ